VETHPKCGAQERDNLDAQAAIPASLGPTDAGLAEARGSRDPSLAQSRGESNIPELGSKNDTKMPRTAFAAVSHPVHGRHPLRVGLASVLGLLRDFSGVYGLHMYAGALSLAAVVLAAGAGSRYSAEPGAKLMAQLDGEPVLSHVLRAVRSFAPAVTVVVLGHGAVEIEAAIGWQTELRVKNHSPERGLASSLQAGIDTLRALPGSFDGAFIVLGDQPLLQAEVMRALADAASRARPADRSAVVPRYLGDDTLQHHGDAARSDRDTVAHPDDDTAPHHGDTGPRNPLLLLRPAWTWVDELSGDEGLARLVADRPDMVLEVPVPGDMPDVDTPADLEHLS